MPYPFSLSIINVNIVMNRAYILVILTALVIASFSCENNLEVVKSLGNPEKTPDITGTNTEIIYSDSAKVKVKIVATELSAYRRVKNPYLEFPKGIHVYFYDDSIKVNAEVSSKYAIYYETKKLWEARNDVVVINTKGEKLNTEQLFLDEAKQIIYSKKYCRITKPDSMQHVGECGMQARQDFTSWELRCPSGTFNIKMSNDQK